ncbi:MAG: exopolysaccharide biosynthesis protein, partial [Caulobacterales bacterium]
LRKRAFGFLLLFLAIPNVIPMPPGLSTIFGVLLLFPSVQMIMGNAQPWFPRTISKRKLRRSTLQLVVDKSAPWLNRIEKLTHERLVFLTEGPAVQVLGAFCLMLGLILMLPIFLGNLFPGIAIALMAIGLIQRDGLFVLMSTPFVALSVFVTFLNIKIVMLAVSGIAHFLGVH